MEHRTAPLAALAGRGRGRRSCAEAPRQPPAGRSAAESGGARKWRRSALRGHAATGRASAEERSRNAASPAATPRGGLPGAAAGAYPARPASAASGARAARERSERGLQIQPLISHDTMDM